MADTCSHLGTIRKVTPSALGCENHDAVAAGATYPGWPGSATAVPAVLGFTSADVLDKTF